MIEKLYPYQEVAVELGSRTNCLIADECGLGKTIEAIGIMHRLREWPSLVICPKSVRYQWQEATLQFPLSVDGGEIVERADQIVGRQHMPPIFIMHYEMLQKEEVMKAVKERLWGVLILDEAHRIKNRKTRRAIAVKQISAFRKVCLTGTPMDRSPAELWSLLNFLYPETFRSYWKFETLFVEKVKNWFGYYEVVGPKNVEMLSEVLAPFFLKRTKEEVAPELPPKIENDVVIEMDAKQAALYKTVRDAKDIYTDLTILGLGLEPGEVEIKNVLSKITKLQQIASDPECLFANTNVPSAKIDWCLEYVQDNPEESIIFFTRFRETALKLARLLGDNVSLIIGGSTGRVLGDAQNKYIVGTIAAMGEGLSFSHIKTAVFVDAEWSTIKMTQAVDRIHRIDITVPKQIIYLRCRSTVDNLIYKALREKWSETRLVLEAIRGKEL